MTEKKPGIELKSCPFKDEDYTPMAQAELIKLVSSQWGPASALKLEGLFERYAALQEQHAKELEDMKATYRDIAKEMFKADMLEAEQKAFMAARLCSHRRLPENRARRNIDVYDLEYDTFYDYKKNGGGE